ncbi:HAD family hydrolase [Rhodovibrionaceae bacterium A322]
MTTLSRPEAVIFDWDNTLVDTWPVIHQALVTTFTHFGMEPWTLEEVHQRVRASARDTFPGLFGEDRCDEASEIFYGAFEACHLDALEPLPGAGNLLSTLAEQGLHLSLVSNKRGDYLRREMVHLGWAPYFANAVGANDAQRDKPSVDPVLLALGHDRENEDKQSEAAELRARVKAESGDGRRLEPSAKVWFVGDTDIDILCAANAGCTGVLLRPTPPAAGEFAEAAPLAHAESCDQLLDLVLASG